MLSKIASPKCPALCCSVKPRGTWCPGFLGRKGLFVFLFFLLYDFTKLDPAMVEAHHWFRWENRESTVGPGIIQSVPSLLWGFSFELGTHWAVHSATKCCYCCERNFFYFFNHRCGESDLFSPAVICLSCSIFSVVVCLVWEFIAICSENVGDQIPLISLESCKSLSLGVALKYLTFQRCRITPVVGSTSAALQFFPKALLAQPDWIPLYKLLYNQKVENILNKMCVSLEAVFKQYMNLLSPCVTACVECDTSRWRAKLKFSFFAEIN